MRRIGSRSLALGAAIAVRRTPGSSAAACPVAPRLRAVVLAAVGPAAAVLVAAVGPVAAVLVAAVLFAGPAAADVLPVYPDGSGPYPTIQSAVDAASAGDVVELAEGTFFGPGNRDIRYNGKAITIRSATGDPATCAIDCQSQSRAFRFVTGETNASVLEGVTISRGLAFGSSFDGWGGAILCAGAAPTIRRCRFYDCQAGDAGGAVAIVGNTSMDARIEDCEFYGNGTAIGGDNDGGGAIAVKLHGRLVVERCAFQQNWAIGGEIVCNDGATLALIDSYIQISIFAGVQCLGASSVLVEGCTLGWTSGDGLVTLREHSTADIRNTLLFDNWAADAVWCDDTSAATMTCSNAWGDPAGSYTGCIAGMEGVSGNLSVDPLLCDPEAGIELCADSPCLPENNACGVRIGAGAEGCGPCGEPTPVIEMRWGGIKARFSSD